VSYYDDTKFFVVAKKYGAWRIIKSNDLVYALVLSFIFSLVACSYGIPIQLNEMVCPTFMAISATMIAVAIAGLAIVASLSDPSFIKILKSVNIYENILFSFYYSSIVSGMSIVFGAIAYIFSIFNKYYFFGMCLAGQFCS
jgi:hypothetical protein